jgi:thiosulfate/3-mercaptopyruvate sulfurtransferase
MRNNNIAKNDNIIIYDEAVIMDSTRLRWIFKLFGAHNVYILNGGLEKWVRENRPVV